MLKSESSKFRRVFLGMTVAVGLASSGLGLPLGAQESEDARQRGRDLFRQSRGSDYLRNSDEIIEVFQDVVADASESTVKLMSGRRQVAFATVISADGLLVTKASELIKDIEVKLSDGTKFVPQVLGIDKEEDIALLKIERDDLIPVSWDEEADPFVGSWLVSVGETPFPIGIGVVSVNAREIAPPVGVMGVFLEDGDPGALITSVVEDSPAEKAGLQDNDVVTHLDDIEIADRPSLQELVRKKRPGDVIELTIQRDSMQEKVRLELGNRRVLDVTNQRSVQQNELGGPLNEVREGFTLAIQHDSGIAANEVGGPVVGLSGKALGINIARAGRVKTYVLPSTVLLPVIEKLKSGEFAPAVVNRNRISILEEELAELQAKIDDEYEPKWKAWGEEIGQLEEQIEKLESQISTEEVENGQSKLAELEEKLDETKKLYRPMGFKIRRTRSAAGKLADEIEFLKSGISD